MMAASLAKKAKATKAANKASKKLGRVMVRKKCSTIPPACANVDGDLCTVEKAVCNRSTGYNWICQSAPVACQAGSVCDPQDGQCKANKSCSTNSPNCHDGDLCTTEEAICNESTDFEWICQSTAVVCPQGSSCNPLDGICKEDDQLIACVAVIDEDDYFGNESEQELAWTDFQSRYPDRPFCLLITGPEIYMHIPQNFRDDKLTVIAADLVRDYGDPSVREDWAALCRLDQPQSFAVDYVGLYIDDSGSMSEYEVEAARDYFIEKLKNNGIEIKKVVHQNENWILPFTTVLV